MAIQVLEANPRISTGARLSAGAGSLLQSANEMAQQYQQMQQQKQQNQAIAQMFPGLENLSPEIQKIAIAEQLKGQRGLNPLQQTQQQLAEEKLKALKGQQDMFGRLMGQEQREPQDEMISQGEEAEMTPQRGVQSASDIDLRKAAAFKGQPGQAGIVGNIAQAELDQREQGKKLSREEMLAKRKEEIGFHKESQKYDEELLEKNKTAKNQINTLKTVEKAIESESVTPKSMANLLRNLGPIGKFISDAILSGDQAIIQASIPALLEGWKDIFGVRLSDADLKIVQDKMPDLGKSKEANRAIVNIMRKYANQTLLRGQIADEIKEKNKGLRPLNYAGLIEKRFDEMVKPIRVINPNTGNIVEVPAYQVGEAIKAGAMLADE